jgi:ribosomal-protein-alanine N-acetyltransferase
MTLKLFETPRLYLRPFTLQDVEDVYAYAKDPQVSKYVTWEPHKTQTDAREFIQNYAFKKYAEGELDPYGIVLKEENRIIGTVGCSWYRKKDNTMSLGYALAREYWGQGLMTEAAQALLNYVFESQEPYLIMAWCIAENKGSSRVMQKLGMSFEGCLRGRVFRHDKQWDMDCYSILKEEWQRSQK